MAKFNLKPIVNFAGQVLEVAVYGLMVGAVYKAYDYATDYQDSKPVGYNDAVKAIMNSGMYSHYKREAVAAVKTVASSEYYKAIVHIAEDNDTYSHDKIAMIEELSK